MHNGEDKEELLGQARQYHVALYIEGEAARVTSFFVMQEKGEQASVKQVATRQKPIEASRWDIDLELKPYHRPRSLGRGLDLDRDHLPHHLSPAYSALTNRWYKGGSVEQLENPLRRFINWGMDEVPGRPNFMDNPLSKEAILGVSNIDWPRGKRLRSRP
ncbi:hypothetical protein ACLOJK_039891 [Asimina triloba]